MIKILEQGIWPNKPSDAMENEDIFFYDETDWCGCEFDNLAGCLVDGEPWLVLSKPEKALDDMTGAELVEKWKDTYPDTQFLPVGIDETKREALINRLK